MTCPLCGDEVADLPAHMDEAHEHEMRARRMNPADAVVATIHSPDCHTAFGRRTPGCPRCAELAAGAPARLRFGGRLTRAERDARHAAEVRAHRCSERCSGGANGQGVCTFGDW